MHWYVVQTKPRQEASALAQLEQQGFHCYMPLFSAEKVRQRSLTVVDKPLFPRYLFIQLDDGKTGRSWAPIRSTRGVSRMVSFGGAPARVPDELIQRIREREQTSQGNIERLFKVGQRVSLVEGPFAGIEGVYQMEDGDRRVMVLIELMSAPLTVRVSPASLRIVG